MKIFEKLSFGSFVVVVAFLQWCLNGLGRGHGKLTLAIFQLKYDGVLSEAQTSELLHLKRGLPLAFPASLALFALSMIPVSRPGFTRRQHIFIIVLHLFFLFTNRFSAVWGR